MCVIYKLCDVENEFEIKLNEARLINPLTPEPLVTARAAWGTCARDAFPPISPTKQNFASAVRGSINQSESVFCALILITLGGSAKASFYAFTRSDQL